MIIPRFLTRHWALYSLVAVITLAISLIACGGSSASAPIATAAPTGLPEVTPAGATASPQPTETPRPTATLGPTAPASNMVMAGAANTTKPQEGALGGVANMAEIFRSPPLIVDVTGNSARVSVTTTIDVVCSVAFGTTQEYGRLATDTDMAGTGHSVHGPLLTGLQPDTTYHLRLGGMGPDGKVYRSENIVFRTEPLEPGASSSPVGDNLALLSRGAQIVGSSSNFAGAANAETWGADMAIDGDPATAWSSNGDGDAAWLEIELPSVTNVASVGFWSRTMGTSAQIVSFRVVSDNGEVAGPFTLEGAGRIYYFDADITGKRLRFEAVDTSGGNTGAMEIEVYGAPLP